MPKARKQALLEDPLDIPSFLKRTSKKSSSPVLEDLKPTYIMPGYVERPRPIPEQVTELVTKLSWSSAQANRLEPAEALFYLERKMGPEARFGARPLSPDDSRTLKGKGTMATKKTPAKKAPKTAKKEGSARKPGSGARIRELIMKNEPTDEILKIIHKEFPDSLAKASDVAWNRGKLRQEGAKLPSNHIGRQPAAKKAEPKKAAKKAAKPRTRKAPAEVTEESETFGEA